MPGRVYYASIDAVAVTAVVDLFFIAAPSDAVVYIEEVSITQDTIETSEQQPLMLFRTTTDNSAVGTANTPNPKEVGDPAFGGTVRTNITGASLSAETTPSRRESQNILNGWHWLGSYEEPLLILSPTAGTAGRASIKVDVAPAASTSYSGYVKIREIGG